MRRKNLARSEQENSMTPAGAARAHLSATGNDDLAACLGLAGHYGYNLESKKGAGRKDRAWREPADTPTEVALPRCTPVITPRKTWPAAKLG